MAIFLLIDEDHTHVDEIKSARGCYKQFDVIEVFEDTTPVVRPPQRPWIVVCVRGLTKSDALKYMQPYIDEAAHVESVIIARRQYRFAPALMPAEIVTALSKDRYAEISIADYRKFLYDKKAGTTVEAV